MRNIFVITLWCTFVATFVALSQVRADVTQTLIPLSQKGSGSLVGLKNGGALYVGSQVQKYDSKTQIWSIIAPLQIPRVGAHTLLLDDGRVLVVDGYRPESKVPVDQAEIYDVTTQTSVLARPANLKFAVYNMAQFSASQVLMFGRSQDEKNWNCNGAATFDVNTLAVKVVNAPFNYCPGVRAYRLKSGDIMAVNNVNHFQAIIWRGNKLEWQTISSPDGNNGVTGVNASGNVFIGVDNGGATYKMRDEGKLVEWSDASNAWQEVTMLTTPRHGSGQYYAREQALGLPSGAYVFYSYRDKVGGFDGSLFDSIQKTWSDLPRLKTVGYYGPLSMVRVSPDQILVMGEDSATTSELITFH